MVVTPGHCIWTESELSISYPRPSEEDGSRHMDGPPDPLVSSPVTSQDEAITAIRAPREWEKKLYCFGVGMGCLRASVGSLIETPFSTWLPLPAARRNGSPGQSDPLFSEEARNVG